MPLYFIAENENGDYDNLRVKIGISKNIEKRLRTLQTGSPYELKLMGWIESDNDRAIEKRLHKKYERYRTHLEWYRLSVYDVLDELKNNATKSYIVTNSNAFEIVLYDRDGIPEYVGAWQWIDVDMEEFCPKCGWSGGMDYNDNYGGLRCLECGFMGIYLDNSNE
jgi:hypothetical protein